MNASRFESHRTGKHGYFSRRLEHDKRKYGDATDFGIRDNSGIRNALQVIPRGQDKVVCEYTQGENSSHVSMFQW